jgi:hypothetical protein
MSLSFEVSECKPLIIGGDDAGLKIAGETPDYLKTKAGYINWMDDEEGSSFPETVQEKAV